MELSDITPMILTHNEEANLRATLQGVAWASRILVVDSFSTDRTLEIISEFPQARVIQRRFDHFANQCNFGLKHINTTWVLSLDADYRCSETLRHELASLVPEYAGYEVKFQYGVMGRPLHATLYPPRTVLYRREAACYERDGHAHRVRITGSVGRIRSAILHDDRKPLSVWLVSQNRYASLEAEKLLSLSPDQMTWKDRVRRNILFAPTLTILYCLFGKGLILDGWRGIYYSFQRSYAELLLSLHLLDRFLRNRNQTGS